MIQGKAQFQPNTILNDFNYEAALLGENEVEIDISYCGLCGSDLGLIDNNYDFLQYPFVPGHEIVGKVSKLGEKVSGLLLGQYVGVGWICGSCLQCEYCQQGNEHVCAEAKATCLSGYGGFSDKITVSSHFVFPLPDSLTAPDYAPLFCAGITVYNPLVSYTKPGYQHIGVVGVGGLGHLALQFANKLGYEVTALSSDQNKKSDALKLGADSFINTSDSSKAQPQSLFDLILYTASSTKDLPRYMSMLKPFGTLCLLGLDMGRLNLTPLDLIHRSKSIVGSATGGCEMMCNMLKVVEEKSIKPQVEIFKLNDINTALDKLRRNDVRYRIVMEVG